MVQESTAKSLKDVCERITGTPVDSLVANPDWGKVNFENARDDLNTAFAIANQLKNLPVELLPDQEFNPLLQALNTVSTRIDAIRKFSIEQGNAVQARDQLVAQLRQEVTNLYGNAQVRIPFLAVQRGDVRRNEEALSTAVERAQGLLKDATESAVTSANELDQIIAAAREASASVGVAHFTVDFTTEASSMESSASRWLWATVIVAGLTIVAALTFPFMIKSGSTVTLRSIELIISKFIVISALFTAAIWCGRMYKASKHQAAVNRHRGNALKTFQAFVKATSDDSTRNAVLLETTRSIFALTNTGYLESGSEGTPGNSLSILEVVKSIAGAAGHSA